jgi:hypothetical protein
MVHHGWRAQASEMRCVNAGFAPSDALMPPAAATGRPAEERKPTS